MVYKVIFLILNYNYFLNVYSYNLVGFIYYIVFFEVKKMSFDLKKKFKKGRKIIF